MKFTLTLAFLFASATLFGQNFLIKVHLTGFTEGTKIYFTNLDDSNQLDSGYINNQQLTFKGHVSEPEMFRMVPETRDTYFNVWVENKEISITGDKSTFSELSVMGSPLNDNDVAVRAMYKSIQVLRDSIVMDAMSQKTDSMRYAKWAPILWMDVKIQQIRVQSIMDFPPSLITMKELYFLRNDLTTDSLKMLFSRFPDNLKNTKYGDVIRQYFVNDKLVVGSRFIDIMGKDLTGKEVKLSDYKGNIVLLDFWAAWCGPCRMNNKLFPGLQAKYGANGLKIFSFSLDTSIKDWKQASREDSIQWINVSDLKGFYSKQAASYKIRGIPKALLIDKNGIIVHIFEGYDSDGSVVLENEIKKLL
jgi:thiol-disulfide isomerase/thioredoxin